MSSPHQVLINKFNNTKIFYTSHEKIIEIYHEYQNLNFLIEKMRSLKEYLISNNIIKEIQNNVVLFNDKFTYSNIQKCKRYLLSNFCKKEQKYLNKLCNKHYIEEEIYKAYGEVITNFNFKGLKKIKYLLKKELKILLWLDRDN